MAAAFLFFIAATAPSFLEDDAAFFNYFADVNGASPLFYYYGYVSFIAGPIAYALSGLPFVVQALLYRAVPFIMLWLCYREMARLIGHGTDARHARWLAMAILMLARGVDLNIWSNLTYAIWPALFAAAFHVIRLAIEDRRPSPLARAAVVVAAVSNPLGLLLGILLLAMAVRGGAIRMPFAILGGSIVALHAGLLANSPDAVVATTDPRQLIWWFAHGYRTEFKLNTLAVVLSLWSLAAVMWVTRGGRTRADRVVMWSLAFLGVGSVFAYVLSDRFAELEGGFRSQHALTIMFAALVCLARFALQLSDERKRALVIGMFLGVSASALGRDAYFHLRGPLETALLKYRFLMVAQEFRQDCRDGDAMVFEDDSTSPIVLCRPQAFAPGRYPMLTFTPTVGVSRPDEDARERPGLIVGKPLF